MVCIFFDADVDDLKRSISLGASVEASAELPATQTIGLTLGGRRIAAFDLVAEGEPVDGRIALGRREVAVTDLLTLNDFTLEVVDAEGNPMGERCSAEFSGDFFKAIGLDSAEAFFANVQEHHTRFKSAVLLELGARAGYLNVPSDFVVRTAALVVTGHRLLERLIGQGSEVDLEAASRLVVAALTEVAAGEALIAGEGAEPDWRHVRWTVSLSTIAGYLALMNGRYLDAATLFEVNVRQIVHVEVAKVSALNFMVGCFAHGVLMSALGDTDSARNSLSVGLEAVKSIVQAQNLYENVWVIGDLINVMRTARQCFVALVRLKLYQPDVPYPIIDPLFQINTAEVQSPLLRILEHGYAPLLTQHLLLNNAYFAKAPMKRPA